MIINATNSQTAASFLQSASARPHKPKTSAASENSETAGASTDQALITSQNIASAVSPLQDTAATHAALQTVRKQFMAQPNVAMLAQANQLPQNALRLLQ